MHNNRMPILNGVFMVGNFVFVFCHLFVSLHTVMWPLKILSSFLKAFFNIIRLKWWSTSWVYELKQQQKLWSPYSDGLLARKSVEAIKTVATCGLFLSVFFVRIVFIQDQKVRWIEHIHTENTDMLLL